MRDCDWLSEEEERSQSDDDENDASLDDFIVDEEDNPVGIKGLRSTPSLIPGHLKNVRTSDTRLWVGVDEKGREFPGIHSLIPTPRTPTLRPQW